MADDKAGLLSSGGHGPPTDTREETSEQRLYFKDNERRIDFMLAYMSGHHDDDEEKNLHEKYHEVFINHLKDCRLQLEEADDPHKSGYGSIEEGEDKGPHVHYIKIHAPFDVLCETAEDLKMKMPMLENDISIKEWHQDNAVYKYFEKNNPFRLKNPHTRESTNYFVGTFDQDRLHEFINHDKPDLFFTPAERGRLVHFILEKTPFGDDPLDIGIGNLIHKGVFLDAFPLHDGPTRKSSKDPPVNERQRLECDWATARCLFKYQPIDAVKEYFGEKVALYFSWLGFYTSFLFPAAIIGILCFIYGVVSAFDYTPVKETCNPNPTDDGTHRFYMCPLCDKRCSYYLLEKVACLYAKVTHFFDNEGTLFFALFMSIWATVFLEFWKRKQVSLAYEWHSMGFEDSEERVRPEYAAANRKLKANPVTGMMEPYMPTTKKIGRMLGTVGVVAFFVMLVVIAVTGVIIFRAFFNIVLITAGNALVRERSKLIVSAIAGLLNLIAINILKFVYKYVAVILTDWENPRTRTDYEDSFTIKMFLFQFFNTYSSIFYIAFFKSEVFVGSPGKYRRIGAKQFRLDGCSVQGCFLELTIQLIIIMVGQQIIGNVIETLLPSVMRWYKDWKAKKDQVLETEEPRWVDDFQCEMQTKFSLFWEYLEIVLQYGFVTMFVAAFPLAPLFALLNNIIEIRVDAYNYIFNCRRPVAQRAEDIGAWYGILAALTGASVIINACVLAFTSELVPKLTYIYFFNKKEGSLRGFVDFSLSTFNVSYFKQNERPFNATENGVQQQWYCRYPGYHDSLPPFDRNKEYWIIQSARLSFILVFVVFVLLITWLVGYIIPDMPKSLDLRIKRENFLAEQAEKDFKEKMGKRKPRPHHERAKSPPSRTADGYGDAVSTSPV